MPPITIETDRYAQRRAYLERELNGYPEAMIREAIERLPYQSFKTHEQFKNWITRRKENFNKQTLTEQL